MKRWNVTVTKDGSTYKCKPMDNPFRFKCGKCGKGVVVETTKAAMLTTTGKCRVCGAAVVVEFWSEPRPLIEAVRSLGGDTEQLS